MPMHNASETTLRNVKRFHNPGSTLRLMVAASLGSEQPFSTRSQLGWRPTQRGANMMPRLCGILTSPLLVIFMPSCFVFRLKPKAVYHYVLKMGGFKTATISYFYRWNLFSFYHRRVSVNNYMCSSFFILTEILIRTDCLLLYCT